MKANNSILRRLIRITCWFEPLILRLGPLTTSYDVICLRLEPTVTATGNVCLIPGETTLHDARLRIVALRTAVVKRVRRTGIRDRLPWGSATLLRGR